MSAYMRRNVWQLHPVDVIVSADHMIETMLPVHCHKWHSIIIVKQESAISIYGFLHFRCISALDDCLKHLYHILCNRQYSCSGIRLCSFYDVSHIQCSLQLVGCNLIAIRCVWKPCEVYFFLCNFNFCAVRLKCALKKHLLICYNLLLIFQCRIHKALFRNCYCKLILLHWHFFRYFHIVLKPMFP